MFSVMTYFLSAAVLASVDITARVGMERHCSVESSHGDDRYNRCHSRINQTHLMRYYKAFLDSADEDTLNAICRVYQSWILCFQSWSAECHIQLDVILHKVPHTLKRLSHICIRNRDDIVNGLECLLTQRASDNVLFRGCHDTMQLRLQANLYHTCSVVSEYIQCEDQLIRSACGSIVADFRLALTLEAHLPKYANTHKCLYQPTIGNTRFSYSLSCPPEFPLVVRGCYSTFQHHRLVMNHKLLAVVKSTGQEFSNFCSSYQEYQQCIRVVTSLCSHGLDMVYMAAAEWKHSVNLGQYLCDQAYKDYHYLWPCYRKLVHLEFPKWCKQLYDTRPSRVQAYRIKCTSHSESSVRELQKRDQLITCYRSFIEKRCGRNASDVIAPLLHLQYSFDYLPPCFSSGSDAANCAADDGISLSYTGRLRSHYIFLLSCLLMSFAALW